MVTIKKSHLLESLIKKSLPISEATAHDASVNEVKMILGECPWLLGIIDFKLWPLESDLKVSWNFAHTFTLGGIL